MFISPEEFYKYQDGKAARGVSEEGRKDYPHMRVQVSVHASEVVHMEVKTIPPLPGNIEYKQFVSYDIRRLKTIGD